MRHKLTQSVSFLFNSFNLVVFVIAPTRTSVVLFICTAYSSVQRSGRITQSYALAHSCTRAHERATRAPCVCFSVIETSNVWNKLHPARVPIVFNILCLALLSSFRCSFCIFRGCRHFPGMFLNATFTAKRNLDFPVVYVHDNRACPSF